MRIALAALPSNPGEDAENLAGLHEVMRQLSGRADLVVVCEAFGQGFESITDDPAHDLAVGWRVDGPQLAGVRDLARECRLAVCLGFIERERDALHSSAVLVDAGGRDLSLYRRISRGWRAPDADPSVYREGAEVVAVELEGRRVAIALCGDLWDLPDRFEAVDADLLLWPVFVNYAPDLWNGGELQAYAEQVRGIARDVVLVNGVVRDHAHAPEWAGAAFGGAAWFRGGRVMAQLPMGAPGVLLVEVP